MPRPLPALVLLLGLAGCASDAPQQILTPFLADDFKTWTQSGSYTVTGQAFLKLPEGRVVTCAGAPVSLIPAVGYNTELEQVLETGAGYPSNYERNAHKYDHKAMCDGAGKFSFEGIPPLNWIVVTRITWQEKSTLSSVPLVGGPDNKGGYLFTEIQVDDNHTKVMLSNQDFVADKE